MRRDLNFGDAANFMFHTANVPCLKPHEARRCAHGAKDDLTYMCITCQARSLYYGPYCEKCGFNCQEKHA